MSESLDQVKPGCLCRISAMHMSEVLDRSLRKLGLVPGTKVCPLYCSPGNHGTVIFFRGAQIALRTRDLKHILVERL